MSSTTDQNIVDAQAKEIPTEPTTNRAGAKRAEILFFYDCRMSNPNGDPNENRPRIDRITKKNYVTEFRLKRTIRDHMQKVMQKRILMRQELIDPTTETGALKRLEELASDDGKGKKYIEEVQVDDGKGKSKKILRIKRRDLIQDHIDIKLFGILFAVKDKINFKQIGPVQFSIGQSLNSDVEEIPIAMTRIVPNTKNEQGESLGGTFGEKYVVRYSFIEFHGFINNNTAQEKDVDLTEQDVMTMLIAMWRGTDSLTTSSKIGQKSRLIIKVNYRKNGYLGDLDLQCKIEHDGQLLENIYQVKLNLDDLLNMISENNEIIESVEYEYNSELRCKYCDQKESDFKTIITNWSEKSKIPISRLNL